MKGALIRRVQPICMHASKIRTLRWLLNGVDAENESYNLKNKKG